MDLNKEHAFRHYLIENIASLVRNHFGVSRCILFDAALFAVDV